MADEQMRDVVADGTPLDDDPDDKSVHSVPLDLDEGADVVIGQQNVGPGSELGGGEFPDPDTPATDAAPGPDGVAPPRRDGTGPGGAAAREGGLAENAGAPAGFADTYREVSAEQAGTATTPPGEDEEA